MWEVLWKKSELLRKILELLRLLPLVSGAKIGRMIYIARDISWFNLSFECVVCDISSILDGNVVNMSLR